MITLLAKCFIRDSNYLDGQKVRQAYGILCGVVGICLNVGLFLMKLVAGSISHSIAVTADAFNNLSDAGSSVVTLFGFHLARAKPDSRHPFGHGRWEYISGLVVSGIILLMAVELVKSSLVKIVRPQAAEYSKLTLVILIVSILVKFYMYLYNHRIGKRLDSGAMKATAIDSLSDCGATFVVLASVLAERLTGFQIDGYCGVLVGCFIFYAGVSAARETLNPLLGQAPDSEFVSQTERLVLECPEICGIHDLIVHDYGPGRRMISLHAEVSQEGDMLALHDAIDNIENRLRQELKCEAVIHMDPIATTDAHVLQLREQLKEILQNVDGALTMHDFRVVVGPAHTNLIFDVVVPFGFSMKEEDLCTEIQERVYREMGRNHNCVIRMDQV